MSTPKPNLRVILSQTSSVIRGHSGHFLALSALFVLPLHIFTVMYPFLLQQNSVIFPIVYSLSVLLFSLCASSSISFATFNGFHHMPVSFISSLKSIMVSFLPLVATQIIVSLIVFVLVGLALLSCNGLLLLGFDSGYFLVCVILISAVCVGLLVYLQISWCLSTAVVVVESEWGFAALRRSSYLVKGMRRVAVSLMMLVLIVAWVLYFWYLDLIGGIHEGRVSWFSFSFVAEMVGYVVFSTLAFLYSLAANTIFFIYCKGAFQVDEELGLGYVRLPVAE